jgi:integrase
MTGGKYKRGNIWWVWWTEPVKDPKTGKVRQKKRFATTKSGREADAKTLLSTKMYESRTRKPSLDIPDPTYEEIRDLWLASKPDVPKRMDGLAYFDGRTHLDKFFAGWQAKNIDVDDIIKFQELLKAKGLRNGIDHAVVSLRTMLNYAVLRKRLHPHQLPEQFPMLRFKRKPPKPIDDTAFEPVCKQLPEPFRGGFTLAYHTGMRLSEVERLTWEQVLLKKRCLYFPSAKTNEERFVPLLSGTDRMLARLAKGKKSMLVFPGFDDRTARSRLWRAAAVKCGLGAWHCRECDEPLTDMRCAEHGQLDERSAKFHGVLMRYTRTTFIRNAMKRGIPIQQLMRATGHKHFSTHMLYNVAAEEDLELMRQKYDGKV